MRFHLAHSVLLAAFVSDLDTAVPILPGFAAPEHAGGSGRRRIRAARRAARVMRAGETT